MARLSGGDAVGLGAPPPEAGKLPSEVTSPELPWPAHPAAAFASDTDRHNQGCYPRPLAGRAGSTPRESPRRPSPAPRGACDGRSAFAAGAGLS